MLLQPLQTSKVLNSFTGWGFAAFLIESFADITLALIFYALLKPVSRELSLLAAFFGLVGTALFAFAELFYLAPTLLMTVGPLNAFSTDQIDELILLSLRFYQFAAMIFSCYYGIAWIVGIGCITETDLMSRYDIYVRNT